MIVSLSTNAIDGLLRYIFQVLNGKHGTWKFAEHGKRQNQKKKMQKD